MTVSGEASRLMIALYCLAAFPIGPEVPRANWARDLGVLRPIPTLGVRLGWYRTLEVERTRPTILALEGRLWRRPRPDRLELAEGDRLG